MQYFLSLGSNICPEENIPAAVKLLKKRFRVTHVSSAYETDPVGPAGPKVFWNMVVGIESSLDRSALQEQLHEIEKDLGRRRDPKDKFAARTLDIDILPQPDYQKHGFIVIPLAEIVPEEADPETGKTYRQLAEKIRNAEQEVRKLEGVL